MRNKIYLWLILVVVLMGGTGINTRENPYYKVEKLHIPTAVKIVYEDTIDSDTFYITLDNYVDEVHQVKERIKLSQEIIFRNEDSFSKLDKISAVYEEEVELLIQDVINILEYKVTVREDTNKKVSLE